MKEGVESPLDGLEPKEVGQYLLDTGSPMDHIKTMWTELIADYESRTPQDHLLCILNDCWISAQHYRTYTHYGVRSIETAEYLHKALTKLGFTCEFKGQNLLVSGWDAV